MDKKMIFVVLKLLTEIEIIGIKTTRHKLGGCAGYIPVFDTLKEAKKAAGKKYEIKVITING